MNEDTVTAMPEQSEELAHARPAPPSRPIDRDAERKPPSVTAMDPVAVAVLALPVGLGLGLLAWRVRRLRPMLTPLVFSAMAWSVNRLLASRHDGRREERIDEALEATFPASDPPALGSYRG
jgi:hypothetical protein